MELFGQQLIREQYGYPVGYFLRPVPIPAKSHTRLGGLRVRTGSMGQSQNPRVTGTSIHSIILNNIYRVTNYSNNEYHHLRIATVELQSSIIMELQLEYYTGKRQLFYCNSQHKYCNSLLFPKTCPSFPVFTGICTQGRLNKNPGE